jgi:hypothetical protein
MANEYLPGVIQIPSTLIITAITQSAPMNITFSVPSTGANTYVLGQLVRLTVPVTYGMYQANGLTGKIITLGINSMSLNIDSSLFDTFVIPSGNVETPASLSPAGSQNYQFNNTSSQVPFQSLNNIGN